MINIRVKFILFILVSILMIIGCTNKNSNLGFPGSDFNNYQITLLDSVFTSAYTYKDSIAAFPSNTKLIIGNYQNTESRIILRFTNLPRNVTLQEDPSLNFYINKRYNPQTMNIKIAQISDKIFTQNTATWTSYFENSNWDNPGGDYTDSLMTLHTKDFSVDSTNISFTIPKEIVQKWINENNIYTNYGLILIAEDANDTFVEFYASEAAPAVRPNLKLKYLNSNNEVKEDTRYATHDTFIHNKEETPLVLQPLIISNIPPRSVYLDFKLPYTAFTGIDFEEDLRKININQATLILSVNEDSTLFMNDRYMIGVGIPHTKPTEENLKQHFDITKMYLYATTNKAINNNKIEINITSIIQHFVSNFRENNGIYIINNQKNMDFSHIYIYGLDEANSELRPKINIKYTVLD